MPQKVSIKKNFFYSSFLTTANYLFTFITYPYVSRVLGVDGIGTVNFVDSVINYFIMLSMMGISIVGIREVARVKTDRRQLDATYSSLLALNVGLTLVALAVLGIACVVVPQLWAHAELVALGAAKLVANVFLVDWVVKGLEDFRAITLRTFVVRLLYVAAVFLFVRDADDYVIYYLLLTVTAVLNALFNLFYLRRHVSFRLSGLSLRPMLSPVFTLGLYLLFGSFYSSFNIMALGMIAGETQVGYYTTATKLFTILLSLFTAFCGVMLPRMSSLLAEGQTAAYRHLLQRSVTLLYAFSLPLILVAEIYAADIIRIISGPGYEGAVLPMQICLPLLAVIGHSKIMLQQGLMPLGRDRAILTTSLTGGILAVACLPLLVKPLGCIGSAWLWVTSELGVNVAAAYYMWRYLHVSYPGRDLFRSLLWHAPLLAVLWLLHDVGGTPFVRLAIGGATAVAYGFVLQCLLLRNPDLRRLVRLRT